MLSKIEISHVILQLSHFNCKTSQNESPWLNKTRNDLEKHLTSLPDCWSCRSFFRLALDADE